MSKAKAGPVEDAAAEASGEPTVAEVAYDWSVYLGRAAVRWGWFPLVIAAGYLSTDPRPHARDFLRIL